ncbi:hypothetical protein OQZ55_00185 [Bacillus subtilis]|uniref:hypothetical protein n=1 Tax=Bacillus subtilis TaxID=1423 RepID=UPI00203A52C5|nr:hypothetical protein [Bacillus subtilis]MCM3191435.1 hypothetical protein [Bacillus subtilis]MCX4074733.1 hypothetical protein [Bacillus subtilis]MEC0395672.1 hypothetical protein [Bacillus subtilis]
MKNAQRFLNQTFGYLGNPANKGKSKDQIIEIFEALYAHFEDHENNSFDIRLLSNLNRSLSVLAVEAIAIFYKEDLYQKLDSETEYLNTTDTASMLGISIQTLRKRLKNNPAQAPKPALYASGVPVWEKSEVQQFIQTNGLRDDKGHFTYPVIDED